MNKKLFTLISLVLVASFALAACGTAATPTEAPAAPVEPAATEAPAATEVPAPVGPTGEVTLWNAYQTGSTEESTLTELVANAQAAYPDLKINVLQIPFSEIFNKYQQEVAAGGGPDMFVAPNDDLGNWVRGAFVADITDKLAGKLDPVAESGVAGMQVDGKLYGVPESAKAVALYYNKSLVPNPPKTTDELLQMVKDGTPMTFFIGAYHMFGWPAAFGGKLLDENGKCVADQGGWTEAYQFLVDLKAAGALMESDYGKAETPFRQGETAMFVNGPWAYGDYKKDLGDNLGVVVMPAGPGGLAGPLNGIDGFYINPNSQNQDAAIELALFLTNQASSQTYTDKAGHIAIRNDVTSSDPNLNAFAEASSSGFPRPQTVEFANYWTPFGDALTKAIEGALTPEQAVTEACAAMNAANGK